ncbi:MAG: hypothetical protein WCL14_03110 [Bacteroidota bacterium]
MKKVLSLMLLAGMLSFYACGPSAEEKAAAEKAKADSAKAADDAAKAAKEAATQDSLAKVKATEDSIAKAKAAEDSAAAKAKGGKGGKMAPTPAPAKKK